MKLLIKKMWEFIKKKCWYIILLILSSVYIWHYRMEIYQLKELNTRNVMFIVWIILMLLPLFSEMEFLGVKIKKEVQKETEEVKETLKNIQAQINNMQLTNSVANNLNINNSVLPSEQRLEELLQKVTELQSNYLIADKKEDTLPSKEDKSVYLFKVRLEIEKCLREMSERLGIDGMVPVFKMVQQLGQKNIIDEMTCDLIIQVNKIANRGVHGEIISEEYIEFVKKAHPEIMRRLTEASKKVDEYIKWNEISTEI